MSFTMSETEVLTPTNKFVHISKHAVEVHSYDLSTIEKEGKEQKETL